MPGAGRVPLGGRGDYLGDAMIRTCLHLPAFEEPMTPALPPAPTAGQRAVGPPPRAWSRLCAYRRPLLAGLGELALIGAVYLTYAVARLIRADALSQAHQNAARAYDLERALHLPSEAAVQAAVGSAWLFKAANVYYVSVHFPVTIAFLIWMYITRPRAEYRWARNLLMTLTFTAVVLQIAFPMAPPRMFPEWGFVDTMTAFGPSAYDGSAAGLANQFAAMPSLHAGWAVLIAVVLRRIGPSWLARLGAAHAVLTIAVITVTANHWFLDSVVAVSLLAVALLVLPRPGYARLPHAAVSRSRPQRHAATA